MIHIIIVFQHISSILFVAVLATPFFLQLFFSLLFVAIQIQTYINKRIIFLICKFNPNQKHFLWTTGAPDSWYSCFVIHIVWKVDKDDKIDPPIQTKNFLSGGARTLTFMVDGAKAVTYLLNLSGIPGNIVVPPLITMLE